MKKSIIAVFSVSITAGTLYLTYSQVKTYLIKKLVGSWEAEMKKQDKSLSPDQVKQLKEELDKLYIWEVRWLSVYWARRSAGAPENILMPYRNRIRDKNLRAKADLRAVDTLLAGT